MPKKQHKKYANVEIQFNLDVPDEEASVIVRRDEMVIDVPGLDGKSKYLIIGKQVQNHFAGINSAGPQTPKVNAKWASLGRIYVGQWIEEGQEYLFSFDLSE